MKPRDRARHKGRTERGSFTYIPHAVQDSPNWRACGGSAIKLLCDLARQFRGNNNGDLCASMSILKPRDGPARKPSTSPCASCATTD